MNNATPTLPYEWIRLGAPTLRTDQGEARSGFQREFVRLIRESPQVRGRVLDIGCGGALPPALAGLDGQWGTLDGVDPDPDIVHHPRLQQRWHACFEHAPIPANAYDLAYAYNVLEHIGTPAPFFRRIHEVLKPGGVFWALTPNALHPFALLSRSIEVIGLKGFARRRLGTDQSTGAMMVNDYPAYYRCNHPRAVARAVKGIGFRQATFYFHPCVQWDTYFPRPLRWIPRSYDFLIGTRVPPVMQIFMVRLEK
jgi:SAM-dependent methyltransferase